MSDLDTLRMPQNLCLRIWPENRCVKVVTSEQVRESRYLMDRIRFRSYVGKMSSVLLSRSRGLGKVT